MANRHIIAIDGPAASGKGTLAKKIAAHFNFAYLDTGSLYRAVALSLLQAGAAPEDEAAALHAATILDMRRLGEADIATALRRPETGSAASIVAAMPAVRAQILQAQRDFAATPPDGQAGAVLDGRDIGTVVCPDARDKLFVTARPEIRAERRWKELQAQPHAPDFETVLADIRIRDDRDMNRATAPLQKAKTAHLLDTSDLSIEQAFDAALALLKA